MTLLTRTGLLEGRRRSVARRVKPQPTTLQDVEICQAAPYSLRPLAALLNPYARGCSVLCNHPADSNSKDALRRMKETWQTELRGGGLLGEGADDALPEELFRRYTDTDSRPHSPPPPPVLVAPMGMGPLPLRRCRTPDPHQHDQLRTEGHRTLLVLDLRRSRSHDTLSMAAPSDSGIWPASTIGAPGPSLLMSSSPGSVDTRAPAAPEPRAGPSCPPAPPPRRPGMMRASRTPRTPCPSLAASRPASQATCRPPRPASQPSGSGAGAGAGTGLGSHLLSPVPRSKSQGEGTEDPSSVPLELLTEPMVVVTCADLGDGQQQGGGGEEDSASGSGEVRRRGKKRRGKKHGKDALREPEKEIHGFPEPGETQVSAIGDESHNPSARPSLTGALGTIGLAGAGAAPGAVGFGPAEESARSKTMETSFLDADSLHHLQRDLDLEMVECEFDIKRRAALEEAYRLLPPRRQPQPRRSSLAQVDRPDRPCSQPLLTVPRVFSLRSARFELPLNTKVLDSLTPLEYVTLYVEVCNSSAQLYRRVFNRHREGAVLPQEQDQQEQQPQSPSQQPPQQQQIDSSEPKYILGQNVVAALGGVLGRSLSETEAGELRERLGWQDDERLEFRTWCGVCALAERLLAPRDDRDHPAEPRPELEQADLAGLQRRLARLSAPDPRLVRILTEVSRM